MFRQSRPYRILAVLLVILLAGLSVQAPLTSAALASYLGSDNRQILNIANPAPSVSTTLGAWQETTPLLSAHADFGGLVGQSSNHVYIVSGCGPDNCFWGGASSDVEGAPVSTSGDIGPWQQLAPFVSGQGTPTVVVGKYLFAVGAGRAVINADGSLGQWEPTNSPTTTGFRPAAAVIGNAIYVLGGFNYGNGSGQAVTSVERAIVNPDGTLGPWEPVSNMVVGRMEFAAFVAGNYLYALGGEGPQPDGYWASLANIERAAIRGDGSLGAWEIIGYMPTARHNFAAVYTHGDLYVLGGLTTAPTCCHFLNTVDKATVNPDGTIGGWQAMAPMLTARASFGAVATDSYLYAIGGWGNITSWMEPLQRVERAEILQPGAVSATGDGWITSPARAYPSNPSLQGKAEFEFSAKLKKGANTPVGQTVFAFKAAKLSFKSASSDSLSVAGAKAQFKGSGTINGKGSYSFLVSVIDGQADGKQGADKFRIKIWNKADGTIVYDNQPGAGDTDEPTMALGGGSIVIRAKNPLPTPLPLPPTPTPNPYPYPYPVPPTPTIMPPTPTPNPYPYPMPPTATPVPNPGPYPVTTIPTGSGPYALAINPVTNKIYVANWGGANVTVIDGATNRTTTVAAGMTPFAIAVNPATNKIYVANASSNDVTVIDGATNRTTRIAVGTDPVAVAVNPVTNKVYVANNASANVTVIDGASDTVAATLGAGSIPFAVAVNSVTDKIYIANAGSNDVTVIDGATNGTTTVPAGNYPFAIAVNSNTNKIYVVNEYSDNVTVIDGETNRTTSIPAGSYPRALAINPATNKIYVVSPGNMGNPGPVMVIIDGVTNGTTIVDAGSSPYTVAVNPVTNKIYVANTNNFVTEIDGATNGTTPISVGSVAVAVDVNSHTCKVYVTNYGSNDVTVIDACVLR